MCDIRHGAASELRRLLPDAPDYPLALKRCNSDNGPIAVVSKGDLQALGNILVGIFCSVRSPGDVILKTYDFARSLRNCKVTIVGGFQSPVERECLDLLMRGTSSIVVCPSRGIGDMRIPKDWSEPLADGRLLILSFFDDSFRRATADLAAKRNTYVAALSERILILHAGKGSKTELLAKRAITDGKPVFALDSPDNTHLIAVGARPIDPDDPSELLR